MGVVFLNFKFMRNPINMTALKDVVQDSNINFFMVKNIEPLIEKISINFGDKKITQTTGALLEISNDNCDKSCYSQ